MQHRYVRTELDDVTTYWTAILMSSFNDFRAVRLVCPARAAELHEAVAYPGILFRAGAQQIQLRTEDRENGDLGAEPPSQGFWRQL